MANSFSKLNFKHKKSFAYGDQARYFEMERFPKIKHRKFGTISMINNGQDMHGSQVIIFFSAVSYSPQKNF